MLPTGNGDLSIVRKNDGAPQIYFVTGIFRARKGELLGKRAELTTSAWIYAPFVVPAVGVTILDKSNMHVCHRLKEA